MIITDELTLIGSFVNGKWVPQFQLKTVVLFRCRLFTLYLMYRKKYYSNKLEGVR